MLNHHPCSLNHRRASSRRWALPAYYVLACAEASSNLARFDGLRYGAGPPPIDIDSALPRAAAAPLSLRDAVIRARSHGLGPEVQRRIITGAFVLGASAFDA